MLKLLAAARDPGTITVRIGEENEAEEMRSHLGGLDRLRLARHGARRDGRGRADPDGLPGHDRRRCAPSPGTWGRS